MAPDHKNYLATELISEQNTVSYRNLSRALKVHVNAAKCMLFEFHQNENKKKPGSVYATYIIAGTRKNEHVHRHEEVKNTNGDVPMPSSPPIPPSSLPAASQATEQLDLAAPITIKTITLCREEDLDEVKTQYEKITSIHIYSLSPTRLPDLHTLSDTGRSVFADHHSKQDPLTHNKNYGIIQNPHVRRRTGKRPLNVDAPQPKIQPAKERESSAVTKSELRNEDAASRPSSRDSATTQDSAAKPKPNLKRDGSSLFKAFAKQSTKPKLERNDTDASANSNNTDAKMGGMDDEEGESEDEAMFLDTGTTKTKKRPGEIQKEKEERQAKLRKMMEDDDDEVKAVPKVEDAVEDKDEPPAAQVGEDADAPDGDEDVAWSDSDAEGKKKAKTEEGKPRPEEKQAPKRRRGKRKVMKKRTMKDEEGFLVTKEEEAWESFSEDEPEPTKKAFTPAAAVAPKSSAPVKGSSQKSSAPKPGAAVGGAKKKDIMSFFGKK